MLNCLACYSSYHVRSFYTDFFSSDFLIDLFISSSVLILPLSSAAQTRLQAEAGRQQARGIAQTE